MLEWSTFSLELILKLKILSQDKVTQMLSNLLKSYIIMNLTFKFLILELQLAHKEQKDSKALTDTGIECSRSQVRDLEVLLLLNFQQML